MWKKRDRETKKTERKWEKQKETERQRKTERRGDLLLNVYILK